MHVWPRLINSSGGFTRGGSVLMLGKTHTAPCWPKPLPSAEHVVTCRRRLTTHLSQLSQHPNRVPCIRRCQGRLHAGLVMLRIACRRYCLQQSQKLVVDQLCCLTCLATLTGSSSCTPLHGAIMRRSMANWCSAGAGMLRQAGPKGRGLSGRWRPQGSATLHPVCLPALHPVCFGGESPCEQCQRANTAQAVGREGNPASAKRRPAYALWAVERT